MESQQQIKTTMIEPGNVNTEPSKPYLCEEAWEHFYHPVCTLKELRKGAEYLMAIKNRGNILPVTLLNKKLVIAELGNGKVVAMDDRCIHRSAALSLGWAEEDGVRCPYHGWKYDDSGKCSEVPAMPDLKIPAKACVKSYDVEVRYDLVWVRLISGVDTDVPVLRSWDLDEMKVVQGEPYVWETSAVRRMENFFDLSHFSFVHNGSLGTRSDPLVPVPIIDELLGQLRWKYYPEHRYGATTNVSRSATAIPLACSDYHVQLPFHVSLRNFLKDDSSNEIWVASSPVTPTQTRVFWFTCRSEDHDGDDQAYADIQTNVVLAEDQPIIESQLPRDLPDDASMEMSVPTDKVHITYRRKMKQLSTAYEKGGAEALQTALDVQRINSEEMHPELKIEAASELAEN